MYQDLEERGGKGVKLERDCLIFIDFTMFFSLGC